MITKDFTIKEIVILQAEVANFLTEDFTLGLKYSFSKLLDDISPLANMANDKRNELIKKYSKDGYGIPEFLKNGKLNPDIKKFNTDYDKVVAEKVSISCPVIDFSIIENIKSKNNYPLIYKHLIK